MAARRPIEGCSICRKVCRTPFGLYCLHASTVKLMLLLLSACVSQPADRWTVVALRGSAPPIRLARRARSARSARSAGLLLSTRTRLGRAGFLRCRGPSKLGMFQIGLAGILFLLSMRASPEKSLARPTVRRPRRRLQSLYT